MSLLGSMQYYFKKEEQQQEKYEIDYDIAFTYSKNDLENMDLCIENEGVDSAYFLEIIDLDEPTKKTNFYTSQLNGYTYSRITLPKK